MLWTFVLQEIKYFIEFCFNFLFQSLIEKKSKHAVAGLAVDKIFRGVMNDKPLEQDEKSGKKIYINFAQMLINWVFQLIEFQGSGKFICSTILDLLCFISRKQSCLGSFFWISSGKIHLKNSDSLGFNYKTNFFSNTHVRAHECWRY